MSGEESPQRDNGSICHEHLFIIESANIFDPDLAYSYSEALVEFDYIIEDDKGIIAVEEVSSSSECPKKYLRNLMLSLSLPKVYWVTGKASCQGPIYPNWRELAARLGVNLSELSAHNEQQLQLQEEDIVNCIKNKASENIELIKKIYSNAGELINLAFYSSTMLPEKYKKIIFKDILEAYKRNSFNLENINLKNVTETINNIIGEAPQLLHYANNSQELQQNYISKCKRIYILLQAGLNKISINVISRWLRKYILSNFISKIKIVLVTTPVPPGGENYIRALEELKNNLDSYEITICKLLNECKCDNINYNCAQPVDKLGGENSCILIVQDWSKQGIEDIIKCLKDNLIYIMIIPESGYYLNTGGGSSEGVQRLMRTFYGFNSCTNNYCKIIIIPISVANGGIGE